MKRCGRCGEQKPVEAFALKNRYAQRLQSYCRQCQHDYYIDYYRQGTSEFVDRLRARTIAQRILNRAFVVDVLLRSKCADCGIRDPIVLEFDHVTGVKRDSISALIMAPAAISSIKAEIAKCDVRCANCHRRKTSRRWRSGIGTRRQKESQGAGAE